MVAINKSLECILTGNCICMAGYFNFKIQIRFSITNTPLIRGSFRIHRNPKVEFFVALVNG